MGTIPIPRIDVDEARRKVEAGQALLVCAYGDDVKCKQLELEGSITLSELQSRLPSLPKDTEIIFYCA
ncbi:MAG TPA: ArsR family transcriptional regulator [Methylomirabilota bacterium]|jgi:rhodanese-related sulfurtransferase|nr:ArsR family transcriptional regulator [Methylomirabilota bacterium]